jgi:hypothetical protein
MRCVCMNNPRQADPTRVVLNQPSAHEEVTIDLDFAGKNGSVDVAPRGV